MQSGADGGFELFQHTAARRRLEAVAALNACNSYVSTHSRPKAAGSPDMPSIFAAAPFQHTAARRRLANTSLTLTIQFSFQHTAARRRLGACWTLRDFWVCFNTQPPEGGWACQTRPCPHISGFNTQPPEGGWILDLLTFDADKRFNTQPPEGGWVE